MLKTIICDVQGVLINIANKKDINEELIDFLVKNKKNYKNLILYSNLNRKNSEILEIENPKFYTIVNKAYYYEDIDYAKPDVRGFLQILSENSLKPEDVIFIDDSNENINSAKRVGIKTIHYKSTKDISILKTLLFL